MSGHRTTLFRSEALDNQRASWLGPILLIRPPRLKWLLGVATLITVLLVAFLVWGEYTKKARVPGYLAPDQGVLKVFAPQAGTVLEQHVQEGQSVLRGDLLFVLSGERASPSLRETQAAVTHELAARRTSLLEDLNQQQRRYRQQQAALESRIVSLRGELDQLTRAIQTQNTRVLIAQTAQARYRELNESKFVSDLQYQQKTDELLGQQGQLQTLERNRLAMLRDVRSAQAELTDLPMTARYTIAAIERGVSELDQQLAESEGRRQIAILAPESGVATAILTEPGQAVTANLQLVSIVPQDAILEAQLFAPSRAMGFIEPGSKVLLRYAAYPYQKFGQYEGTVKAISKTALAPADVQLPSSNGESLYRISVKLANQTATAYGHAQPLQAGMQVEADILLDRRRLIEWVFEPLYSLTGRV